MTVRMFIELSPNQAKVMDFNGALNQSEKWGHFGLSCDMPPNTEMLNILIREY